MKTIAFVAVSLAALLFLSSTALTTNADTNIATRLTLEPIFSRVAPGDEVVFTGILRTATGEGLADMTIRIMDESPTESTLLATAVTNEQGVYEATWVAELIDPTRKDYTMTIFAIFDGHDQYYGSKISTPGRLGVNLKLMTVGILRDSNDYFAGQNAIFVIRFLDGRGYVDPENVTAIFNGITVNLTKHREGIYTYTTPELEPKIHTFRIIAEKQGYDPVDRSGKLRVSAVSDDLTPPTSSVLIEGLYNNETNWYYDRYPVATVNATDHHAGIASGVRHVVVQYFDIGGDRCNKNVCSLQPGENFTLSHYRHIDTGRMDVVWFAQDNTGNTETPNKLSIYVDTLPPRISVLNITSDTNDNIFTGSNCNKYRNEETYRQCIIVRAFPNEIITFRVLAYDLLSGVKSVYYRVGPYSAALDTDWQLLETASMPFSHHFSFKLPQIGAYKLQMKVDDIAGNESTVREFAIFIAEPLLREFKLSITDFIVKPQFGKSLSAYHDISALIRNNTEDPIKGNVILLIAKDDGITSHIETMDIRIKPYGELDLKKRWLADQFGSYTIKMFIWSKGGFPLASPAVYETVI
ncbi:MAG: hypothetical protein ACE5KA_07685 [Nitrososphaerales archaeon]